MEPNKPFLGFLCLDCMLAKQEEEANLLIYNQTIAERKC
jgi:hypothetical protein